MSTAHDTDRLRKAELAKIHIAKKQLGLDDEAYELMVWEVSRDFRPDFPVTSSGDMTSAERKALLQKMQSMGAHSGPPKGEKPMFGDSNEPHVRKLFACAEQLIRDGAIAPSDPARWLRKFVKRLTGVEDPRWLTPLDCNKVIEALKAWHRRLDARAAQKARTEITPRARVKSAAAQILERLAQTEEPRQTVRNVISLLTQHQWPSPRIANAAIELIREHGGGAHIALSEWDYRGAKKELRLLIEKIEKLDPSIWGKYLNSDESETESGARPQSKVEDGR
jgi:hypothetical protein